MKEFLFFVVLMGYLIYRTPGPVRNIYPASYVVDTFTHCTNRKEGLGTPIYYTITTSSYIVVDLLDDENYKNMTKTRNYTSIKTYDLAPMINYNINLTKYYHKINGTCHIVTRNNNGHIVFTKWRYLYPPLWKYILYIMSKDRDRYNLIFD